MKGQAEFMEWFPRMMLLLVAVIIIVMLVRYFSDREIDTSGVHVESYVARLLYDDIIMHKDATGRIYPGTIDMEKFLPSRIDVIYGTTGKISSRLILTGCVSEEIYHDQETYDEKYDFAVFGTLGPGGATIHNRLYPVTVRTTERSCSGMLNITIVRPNT